MEAACLAHDLGHPPFGHVGERTLNDLMRDAGGFDSNAQSFRVVCDLEEKKPTYPGLNLSRAVLLAMLKYPYERSGPWKEASMPPPSTFLEKGSDADWIATQHFLYDDQRRLSDWMLADSGVKLLAVTQRAQRPPRTLPCAIVDWADDIAYSVHDLEDGIVTGFLTSAQLLSSEALVAVMNSLQGAPIAWKAGRPPEQADVFEELQGLAVELQKTERGARRGALRQVTRRLINDFILCTKVQVAGSGDSLFDFELVVPEEMRVRTAIFKALTYEYLLKDPRIVRYMYKGREILRRLFLAFVEDPKIIDRSRDQLLDRPMRHALAAASNDEVHRSRVFADHLSGMTERSLVLLYQTLFESAGGSPLR